MSPSRGESRCRKWLDIVRSQSPFLLLAAPPLALLSIFALADVSLDHAIRAIIWIEALSIGFWAGLAARRACLHGSSLAVAVLAGLIVSGIVLALQVLLQPGEAVKGGVAAGKTILVALAGKPLSAAGPRCCSDLGRQTARAEQALANIAAGGRDLP